VKLIYLLQIAFPSAERLSLRYPVLEKAPILLPVFWLWRGVSVLLLHRDRVQSVRAISNRFNAEAIAQYQASLREVGLDYHFS